MKDSTARQIIDEIHETGVVRDARGGEHQVHSHLEKREGEFLFQLITADQSVCRTLEVGCAFGLSSLYICDALSARTAPSHVIIDPFQHSVWQGVGLANLERAGVDFFDLIEEPSEFALPKLAAQRPGEFDMVLIDGWHTFDHTLVDLFFANRLVRVGGYVVVDDCNYSSVAKAVSYFSKYPAYRVEGQSKAQRSVKRTLANAVRAVLPPAVAGFVVPRRLYDDYYVRTVYSAMVALKKVDEDDRGWKWFASF